MIWLFNIVANLQTLEKNYSFWRMSGFLHVSLCHNLYFGEREREINLKHKTYTFIF